MCINVKQDLIKLPTFLGQGDLIHVPFHGDRGPCEHQFHLTSWLGSYIPHFLSPLVTCSGQ